jgi:hypothetical protein
MLLQGQGCLQIRQLLRVALLQIAGQVLAVLEPTISSFAPLAAARSPLCGSPARLRKTSDPSWRSSDTSSDEYTQETTAERVNSHANRVGNEKYEAPTDREGQIQLDEILKIENHIIIIT